MDTQEQVQGQEQEKRSYENSPWIHVHDWSVSEHANSETGEKFWSVKLPTGTTIQHENQTLDVSHYRFTTNYEPALTHGEAGTPKAMRGIHFPEGWEITLQRIENVAKEGHEPIFDVTDRIEKVTPKELADGLDARDAQWRAAHRKPSHEQEAGKDAQEQAKPGRAMYRSAEPAL